MSLSLDSDSLSHDCEAPSKPLKNVAKIECSNKILQNLRHKNGSRLICAQLNINSKRNEFDCLIHLVQNNIDILVISEKN